MTKIIHIDLRSRWVDSVRVRAADGRIDNIVGPGDALSFLVTRWNRHKGPSYRIARRSCQEALRGNSVSTLARMHFITACLDANILE
ncbi:DUF982 domain-containing protein [Pararhizobium sp. YC-54]|uniref:DUF982 domain-containing protein n=1 Tax=Pararhizobium sp. YC-54 TaxID=2986920 RepID=UPI003557B99E